MQRDHAVVLGASMAGLLAARVLAESFRHVTIVERDDLAPDPQARRGVPQAEHAHLLLVRGARIFEELFPGLLDDLVGAGVPVTQNLGQVRFNVNGHLLFHEPDAPHAERTDGALYHPSRPFLESQVLRRVVALPNLALLDGYDVTGLTADRRGERVVGVRATPRDDPSTVRDVPADLVVVATGRSGRTGAWLRELGHPEPVEENLSIDLRYVSRRVRFPAGSVDHLRALAVGALPGRPTGAGAMAQEGGSWIITLFGYRGYHPPTDPEGWLAQADEVLPADVAEALHEAEPLNELRTQRFPSSMRRRFERLGRFPAGLLVTGDAFSSFNPAYGQGMTVAALEALALRQVLEDHADDVAPRFFRAAARPVGVAWSLAAGADLGLPPAVVPGPRPASAKLVAAYMERFQAAAEHDPVLAWRFFDATGFDVPVASMFGPDSLRRLARAPRGSRTGAPRPIS